MTDAPIDQAEQVEQLPAELARLEQLARQADAQLEAGQPVELGAQVDQPMPDEQAEVTAMLCLASRVAGMWCPPLGQAYPPEACASIAEQYLRCAEQYGWTFHKSASNPIVGLVAVVSMPAILNAKAIADHFKQQPATQQDDAAPKSQPPDAANDPSPPPSHRGLRIV